MPPLLLPAIEELAHLSGERGEDFRPLGLVSGAEMEAKAHPIQLQPVEIVPRGQLADELHVILAHLWPAIVEGAIRPLAKTVRDATKLGVLAPELAVDVAALVVHIVYVVHAHGEPGRDASLARAPDPSLIDVNAVLSKLPGGVNPLPRIGSFLGRKACQERLVIGASGIVPSPDGVPDFACIARTHAVGAEHQLLHLRARILVNPGIHLCRIEPPARAGVEIVAVVLVQGNPRYRLLDHPLLLSAMRTQKNSPQSTRRAQRFLFSHVFLCVLGGLCGKTSFPQRAHRCLPDTRARNIFRAWASSRNTWGESSLTNSIIAQCSLPVAAILSR